MATENPWYGYKRIAVMCRRAGQAVRNRQAYRAMKDHGLLHKRRPRTPELYQAAKLYELLPRQPNDLWQMYVITVIDYYSRYLLAAHFTSSYCAAEAIAALVLARAEAQRVHGPLEKRPFLVTDNGSSYSTGPSKRRRSTGSSTTDPPTPAPASRAFATGTTNGGRTGRWCPRTVATP
jgi:hypothetical protein